MKIMNDLNENDDKLAVGYLDYRCGINFLVLELCLKYVLCIQFNIISRSESYNITFRVD